MPKGFSLRGKEELKKTREFKTRLYSLEELIKIKKEDASSQIINGPEESIFFAKNSLVKVNQTIGMGNSSHIKKEIEKCHKIVELPFRPDVITDASVARDVSGKELWQHLRKIWGGIIRGIPAYMIFDERKGLDQSELLNRIEKMAHKCNILTFHVTADLQMERIAKSYRKTSSPSRGHYVILKDVVLNNRRDNILKENLNDILKILNNHKVAFNIGSCYRAGTTKEAGDKVQMVEIC